MTGYEAFGDFKANPSIEVCRKLYGRTINGYDIAMKEIAMKFDRVKEELEGHLEAYRPVTLICTGVSGAGSAIPVEQVAINCFSASGAVMGMEAQDMLIREGGPAGYFNSLPCSKILDGLKKTGIPARLSNSAGTMGCNLIFYHLMDWLTREHVDILAGFIHLPRLPDQALDGRSPSMTVELSARALEIEVRIISELG